ncbi:MAG: T9SS type A sorting domain-containing protein [Bacteroidales bacterium]|jgi:hypothetical protein|nr:T9SS type A sorting domain-containing protein [Bacteroidales bacterium]
MNKIVIILFIVFSVSLFSQISITENNYYHSGTSIPMIHHEDIVPLSQVISNPLQLSNSSLDDLHDTLFFLSPEEIDFNNVFPDASCTFYLEFPEYGAYVFERTSENKSEILGIIINIPMIGDQSFTFNKPLTLFEFPTILNHQFSDHSSSDIRFGLNEFSNIIPSEYSTVLLMFDTIRALVDISISANYTDFGKITLSGTNVFDKEYNYIREFKNLHFVFDMQLRRKFDGSWVPLSSILSLLPIEIPITLPIDQTNKTYSYWTNDYQYPIAEIILSEDQQFATRISLRYDTTTNETEAIDIFSQNSKIYIYPNPVNNFIYINNEENINNLSISIYSVDGKLIQSLEIQNSSSLDISNYKTGYYFYKITNKEKQFVKNGQFVKR